MFKCSAVGNNAQAFRVNIIQFLFTKISLLGPLDYRKLTKNTL